MKTIYINGEVYTVTQGFCEAFVVQDNQFIYAGTNEEALRHADEASAVIDLENKFVTAGFNDSHMHVLNFGYTLNMANLAAATTSLNDVLECLKTYIQKNHIPEGSWVKGRGWNHDFFSDVHRFPTRYDLDLVSTQHPILITRACGHVLVCNSKAIELLGLTPDMEPVVGGEFEIVDNELNGVFKENALNLIYSKVPQPTVDEIKTMLIKAFHELNTYGITSAQSDDLVVFENYKDILQAFKELDEENKMTIKLYEQSHFTKLDTLKEFLNDGYNTGKGTEYFKIGPLKLMADGSLGARTALMSVPYADDPTRTGVQVFTQDELNEMVDYASSHGMQVAIHSIGDKSADMIIEAYERTLTRHPRTDHRHGIVHCQITRPDILDKFKELELQAYIQSIFLDYDIMIVEERVGHERAQTSYAFKTLFDVSHASNGSDCPVELPDVLKGMQCAVTRSSTHGQGPYIPSQALSVEEAIQSFTIHGAYASFEENLKGSIEVGKAADFVVLEQSPFKTDTDKIKDIKVCATYLNGRCIYKN